MQKIICGDAICPNCGATYTPSGNKQTACSPPCILSERSVSTASGCLEWQGYRTPKGYGEIRWKRKTYRAHRLAWELVNGAIPQDKMLLHSCDNPACINLSHLRLGTAAENTKDMLDRKRNLTGDDCSWSKIARADASFIKGVLLHSQRGDIAKLASMFNVNHTTILKIKNGTNWKDVEADPKARL